MKYILIINGYPTSGKDLFIKYLSEISEYPVYTRSWVDKIKEIAKEHYNWDGTKTPENRKLLADLTDTMGDHCFQDIINHTPKEDSYIYCVVARRPTDIQKIREYFNFHLGTDRKVRTVVIRRDEVENKEQSNTADSEVLEYWYDYHIFNNSTKDEFKEGIKSFFRLLY